MNVRRLLRRATYLLRRRRHEDDLVEELEFHQAMTRQSLDASGLDPSTAGHETRRTMGGMLAARDQARDVWIWPWLQSVAQDARFAARLLIKERSFTLVAVTALALGIGVNSMFFTIVNAICLRGLPIDEVDRVVAVGTRDSRDRVQGLSYRDFDDLRADATLLASVTAWSVTTLSINEDGLSETRAPDRVSAAFVSAGTFRLIRESPRLGRDFEPADDRPGAAPVVILEHELWQRRYAGNPGVLGSTLRVGGAPATIVGVMPPGVKFPGADLWQPLAQLKGLDGPRDARTLSVIGRLKNGAGVAEAGAEAQAIATRLAERFPETNAGIRATVVPINERYNSPIGQRVWVAFITVGVLLVVVACANVANLLLMRTARRTREIALRAALGATRRRILRQLLIESLLLAGLGGATGLWVSLLASWLFESATPEGGLPWWVHFTMDARVFGMLAAVCLGTVLIFGLTPALHASKADANDVLKEAGRTGSRGVRARRWTTVFLTCEFALTMLLLAAVVDTTRAFLQQERTDLVIDTSRLLTMWIAPAGDRYETPAARLAFYRRLEERLGGIPSIGAASLASTMPFSGAPTRQLAIDGRPDPAGRPAPTVWTTAIGPRFFDSVGVAVRRGRAFTTEDGAPGQEHAIVNQRFVDMYFPSEEAIGRRIRLAVPGPAGPAGAAGATSGPQAPSGTAPAGGVAADADWLTIVGVSPNVRPRGSIEPDPVVYVPLRADPPATVALLVRARTPFGARNGGADAGALASLLRGEVRALDPDLPVYRVRTMEQVISELRWNPRLSRWLVTIVSMIALALAAVGLYAVTSHAVALRTQEIGVRLALGASTAHVRWIVLRRALMPLLFGLVFGLIAIRAFEPIGSGALDSRLTKPPILFPVTAILVVVAAVACIAPARRAARLDPVVALRHD